MLPLDACVGRAAEVGGKAEALARARAAGLPVADGLVVLPDEPVDAAALQAALARLGGARFAVRSSASVEDAARGSAAGLFTSVVGVPGGEVARAVDEVRQSARGPALAAYLAARGIPPSAVRVAVLIQPLVVAERYGVAHSAGAGFVVEERAPGEPEWGDVQRRVVARDEAGPLAAGLRALEGLVGGAVDAELARTGERVTWLQARPLAAQPAAPAGPRFAEPGRWTLDAEHNPDPLSTAQAALVAFVDGLGVGPRQRVVDRYLYVERGAPARGRRPIPLAELRRRFDEDVVPDCTRALEAAAAAGGLDAALDAYAHVYRRYVGEVAPSLAEARAALDALLRARLGEPLAAQGALLGGLGGATLARDQALWALGRAPSPAALEAYLGRFGDHAPAWDVATPTDRETPARVHAQAAEVAASAESPLDRHARALAAADAAAQALARRLDPAARRALAALLPAVREVLPIAEDDDLLFLRAQATVRRALLSCAPRLGLARAEDVFELTLDEARGGAAGVADLRARVAERQAAREAAAGRVPPLEFDDGRPSWPTPRARDVLRGAGTAGQARGRAVVVRALADAPATLPRGAVLVTPAIVPSLTPLLAQARALVTDHGGALSHGATLAREYGVPAVLGVGRATALADGAELWVDADAGRVYVLGPADPIG